MIQEDPNKLEKKMIAWREEKKQIKESQSTNKTTSRLIKSNNRQGQLQRQDTERKQFTVVDYKLIVD